MVAYFMSSPYEELHTSRPKHDFFQASFFAQTRPVYINRTYMPKSYVRKTTDKSILYNSGRKYKDRLVFILVFKWSLYFRPEGGTTV